MMIIDNKYNLGDFVYVVTDKEQEKRQIIEIDILPSGLIYRLNCGERNGYHYECELSDKIDILIKTE